MLRFPPIASVAAFQGLCARELQVILLASDGLNDEAAARQLRAHPRSVVRAWARVKAKLGADSRTPAVALLAAATARIMARCSRHSLLLTGSPGVAGRPSETEVLVSPTGVVLSCTPGASRVFGLWPGLLLKDSPVEAVYLCNGTDARVEWGELLCPRQLEKLLSAEKVRVFVPSTKAAREFELRIHALHDPCLGDVMHLEFKPFPEAQS